VQYQSIAVAILMCLSTAAFVAGTSDHESTLPQQSSTKAPGPATGLTAGGTGANLRYVDSSSGITDIANGGGHLGFKFIDLDGDGNLDILSNGGRLGLEQMWGFLGDGRGGWRDASSSTGVSKIVHNNHGGVGIADVDNDGDQDFAVGSHGGLGYVGVYRNDGAGQWVRATNKNTSGMGGEYDAMNLEWADVNNDGLPDLIVNGFWTMNQSVYLNTGGDLSKWTPASTGLSHAFNSFYMMSDLGDIDRDGFLDTVSNIGYKQREKRSDWVWFGDGKGSWTRSELPHPAGVGKIISGYVGLGDVNGDGHLDVAIPGTEEGGPFVFFGNAGRTWQDASGNGLPKDGKSRMLKLADFDSDGADELLRIGWDGSGNTNIEIWKWSESGWNQLNTTFPTTTEPIEHITLADVDRNGYLDIGVQKASGLGKIEVWRNEQPAGALAIRVTDPAPFDRYYPASMRPVKWISMFSGGSPGKVKLELSTAGSGGPWTPVADNLADLGLYQWIVPNFPSKNCFVRATLTTSAGTTSGTTGPFEIIGSSGPEPMVARVASPNGGETLTIGSVWDVKFDVIGGALPASGSLDVSTAGPGGPWTKVTDLSGVGAGASSFAWTVPATPTKDAFMRVNLQDSSPQPQSSSDSSNAAFEIAPRDVVILDRVEISPASVTLDLGQTASFTAKAIDTKGRDIAAAQITWSSTGGVGALTPTGATADLQSTTYGSGTVDVEAVFDGLTKSASATVEVRRPVLAKVVVDPTSVSGKVGESFALRAKAIDDRGKEMTGVEFAWSVSGGVGAVEPASGAEVKLALQAGGKGEAVVTATASGKEVHAKVPVTVKEPFVFPWWLLILLIAIAVALIIGAAAASRRRKRCRWCGARHTAGSSCGQFGRFPAV